MFNLMCMFFKQFQPIPQSIMIVSVILLTSCGGGGVGSTSSQSPDAVVHDLPVAFIKRTLPVDNQGILIADDIRNPAMFNPGAELILLEIASPGAAQTVLTSQLFATDELYDVKDLEVSSDGNRLIFALRAPEIPNVDVQPTWNIWQYQHDTQTLTRIITSDLIAEQGQDTGPAYLPDGRIIFTSTRQRSNKSTLLDEGKPQYAGLEESRRVEASVIHIMDADGTNIRQLSFNQSHDLDPYVISDGRIIFSRWDNMGNRSGFNLYSMSPDGRNLEFLYGNHSHSTGTNSNLIQFTQPREMPNGQILTKTRALQSNKFGGDLTQIDTENYTENTYSISSGAGMGQAQISLTPTDVTNDESTISVGGYYSSAFPLWDGTNRILVNWSLCRLAELDAANNPIVVSCTAERLAAANPIEADPLYGVWMLSLDEQTILPIVNGEEGFMYDEVVAMQPRTPPLFIQDGIPGTDLDQDLVDEKVGVVHIRSVYDFDGIDVSTVGITNLADPLQTLADARPARFIRLVKAVSIPDRNVYNFSNTAFGRSSGQLMREILGYIPVEPDGSVKFKVPSDVPFAISVLDKQGRRITGRHQNWLQVKSGEELECKGCHSGNSELPHGRSDAEAASINVGATTTGVPFPNTEASLFADAGETMAETYARINGVRTPSVDIHFIDDWTDASIRAKDLSFDYQYSDLLTPAPTTPGCLATWSTDCRITINYVDVIQPIWELPRITYDVDGISVLTNNTCTACHSPTDALNLAQVPAAQLDLTSSTSTDQPDHLTSYRELLFPDVAQEIGNTILVDTLVPLLDANGNIVFEVDIDGNLILDINGDPIPVMVTVGVSPALSVGGSSASSRLFNLFVPTGTHFGRLSDAELKLIAEWLDVGGQYYNNPFDAPPN